MAFDLTDIELQATREMNKTAWESEIDKWSKEYLIERYKDLVEIEKEHKKENGELRETLRSEIYSFNKMKELAETIRKENVEYIIQIRQYELHYIPKSKVREKIEELEKEQEQNRKELDRGLDYLSNEMINSASKKIGINMSIREYLQELLERND